MKKHLLSEGGNFYKANLHCHSVVSDGVLTPEELKAAYLEKGYSIIAFTDHEILMSHDELTDEGFLALSGYEMGVSERVGQDAPFNKKCHICFIALEPDNLEQICWDTSGRSLFAGSVKYKDMVNADEKTLNFKKEYTCECLSEMMRLGRENGFFVTYNHPAWSMETYEQYSNYTGMHAMEISNYGCIAEGYEDYVPMVYDEMLRGGKRIFCISTDDNHNQAIEGVRDAYHDSFGGFTVIKAERLDYRAVACALRQGNFYASQGPEIYELYVEDDEVHIVCSTARSIDLCTGRRRCERITAKEGEALTEATFRIYPEKDVYFRLTVTDERGYHANTNAYFCDELK